MGSPVTCGGGERGAWRAGGAGTHLYRAAAPGEECRLALEAEEVRLALCELEAEDLRLAFHELRAG